MKFLATIAISSLMCIPGGPADEVPLPEPEVKEVIDAKITAYTSTPEETDDTPFITASGEPVRDGIVANNCLPFGTEVEIKGKIYEVQDRKHSRYGCEWFDIWMADRDDALQWGVRHLAVLVL